MSTQNELTFFISGNTPSSKNSRVWTGKYSIPSVPTRKWIKLSKKEWLEQKQKFLDAVVDIGTPYYVEFTFIRKTRRKFDYINIAQAVCDQMKFYGWIADDDADNLKPYFGDYIYDKYNPGVIIRILKEKPQHYDSKTFGRAD